MTIERINNDGNYEPSNCKWATRAEQAANKRGNFKKGQIGLRGESAPWAKITTKEVEEIRMIVETSQRKIAIKYGISQSMVSMIRNRKNWIA